MPAKQWWVTGYFVTPQLNPGPEGGTFDKCDMIGIFDFETLLDAQRYFLAKMADVYPGALFSRTESKCAPTLTTE